MALRPIFAGKKYEIEIISPDIGHTDGPSNATFFILTVEDFGVTHGTIPSMRKFRRQMKRLLNVRELTIKRTFIDCSNYFNPDHYVLWHVYVWEHLEKIEAKVPVNDNVFQNEINAFCDWPGNPVPERRCRVISYDRMRNCQVIFDGRPDKVEVAAKHLYRISPVTGDRIDFGYELLALPRRPFKDGNYGIRALETAA